MRSIPSSTGSFSRCPWWPGRGPSQGAEAVQASHMVTGPQLLEPSLCFPTSVLAGGHTQESQYWENVSDGYLGNGTPCPYPHFHIILVPKFLY